MDLWIAVSSAEIHFFKPYKSGSLFADGRGGGDNVRPVGSGGPLKPGAGEVRGTMHSSGQLDGAAGTATDCVLVNGSSAAKANTTRTHAPTDIVRSTLDNARTSSTANATASTLVLPDEASASPAFLVFSMLRRSRSGRFLGRPIRQS